ncbi:hypothetical protein GCM10027168_50890 [Streptomyces capparidis]
MRNLAAAAAVAAAVAAVPATATAFAGPSVAPSASQDAAQDAAQDASARPAAAEPRTAPEQRAGTAAAPAVQRTVNSGNTDGKAWSVTLEYHRALPDGFPKEPGMRGDALLCERTVIGGVLVDARGGPWAGCEVVAGPRDTRQGAALRGLSDKGLSGTRVFVATTDAATVRGELTFADGERRAARVVRLPGTAHRAFAVPIGEGETIASVDTFDARGERLTHDTFWR